MTDEARARWSDPETSHEAARSVVRVTETQSRILAILAEHHPEPLSDEQIAQIYYPTWGRTGRTPQGLRSRRADLVKKGMVRHSGFFGETHTGRRCRLWAITLTGYDFSTRTKETT